jgi:hypothetical protein
VLLTGTFIKEIRLSYISFAKPNSLSDFGPLSIGNVDRLNGIQISPLRKRVPGVVHDGVVIVNQSQRVHLFIVELVEVVLLTYKPHQFL